MLAIQYKIRRKFHRFPLLPAEIRHLIWYFCLPRRIVDFDFVDEMVCAEKDERPGVPEENLCECFQFYNVKSNRQPPIIMRVCREAYEVALRHGSTNRTGNLPTWLQPRVDRMLFYHSKIDQLLWYCAMEEESYQHDRSRSRQLAAVFDWAGRVNMPLAFYHLDLYPCRFETSLELQDWQYNFLAPQIAFLNEFAHQGRGGTFLCAVETVVLHVTRQQAADSGRFGRLGEDLCQFVDVDDRKGIRQYYQFWQSTSPCKHRTKSTISRAWAFLLANGVYRREVDDWLVRLEYVLLAAVWKTARANGHQSDASLEGVFSPHEHVNFPIFDCHKIVETHPWVIATREWLPTVLPRICFRACWEPRCIDYVCTSMTAKK